MEGWEGPPSTIIEPCQKQYFTTSKKTLAYYNETIDLSARRMYPLVSYFHQDSRPDKFQGTAIQMIFMKLFLIMTLVPKGHSMLA